MNILLTGGTGFLGRPLVDALLSAGHSVNYLARRQAQGMDSRAAYRHWASSDELPDLAGAGRFDGVIHLAGEPVAQRWTAAVKRRIRDSRVNGTRNLVQSIAGLRHKPAVLISASAIGYYGHRDSEILTESSGPGTGFLADVCVAWEHEANAVRELGIRVATVRIGVVLEKDGGALAKMLPVFRSGMGGKLGDGRQWMSWIHRGDLVGLLRFALENNDVQGAVNATSPNPVTNAEFTRELGEALHRPAILAVPRFALKLAMGPVAEPIMASARVLPAAAEALGFQFRYPDLDGCLGAILKTC